MKYSLLVPLLGLLLLSACSKKQESQVRLEVSNSFLFGGADTAAVSGGGLMVWGQSHSGASFARTLERNDTISVVLKNDVWKFYVMSWSGSMNWITTSADTNFPLGGTVRCAHSPDMALVGGAVNVSLTLNNASCDAPVFKGSVPTTAGADGISFISLPKLKLRFCDSITRVAAPADICTDDLINNKRKGRKAPVGSFRVKLRNHFSNDQDRKLEPGGIVSPCVRFTGNPNEGGPYSGTSSVEVPAMPAGGPGSPFHITLEVFPGDDTCHAANLRGPPIIVELPHGSTSVTSKNKYFPDSTSRKHVQTLNISPADICKDRGQLYQGAHPFAGGDGTLNNPFIICSVPQIFALNLDDSYMSSHFKLQANLDFAPFTKGITTAPLPPLHNCLEPGSNFLPLGRSNNTCANGVMAWNNGPYFTGKFFGAGMALKNIRINAPKEPYIGMFTGFSHGTVVQELEIHDARIKGACHVGGLVGKVFGLNTPASINIKEFKLLRSKVEAVSEDYNGACQFGSRVGGIAGEMSYGTLYRSWVLDSKVTGKLHYAGGAVGLGITTSLNRVAVEADVIVNPPAQFFAFKVGGVIGSAQNSAISYVKHEGLVSSKGHRVGGIAGSMSDIVSFTNFYAISSVINRSSDDNSFTGGVVGDWMGIATTPLGPGYSLSMVRTNCNTNISECSAGPIKGGASNGGPGPNNPQALYKLAPINQEDQQDSQHIISSVTPQNFGVGETPLPANNFIMATGLPALPKNGNDDWIHVSGTYPRFDFEQHPCSNENFAVSGEGSLVFPKIICGPTQYLTIGNADSGAYLKLMSTIRLPNEYASSPSSFDINSLAAHLDGNNKSLIAGYRNYNATLATAHIGLLMASGSIKKLKVHGMARDRLLPSVSQTGILLADNRGTIEDIDVIGFADFTDLGAGVVGKNWPGAVMNRVSFTGKVRGASSLAGLVSLNQGTVSDSYVAAELVCDSPICTYFSGIADKNDSNGLITRTEMAGKINDTIPNASTKTSMLVDANDGTIQDVLVSPQAVFTLAGGEHAHYTRVNNGTIRRAANFGRIISTSKLAVGALEQWPTNNGGGEGQFIDLYRAGRSGKLILENAPYSCNDGSTLNISGWDSDIYDYLEDWETFFMNPIYSTLDVEEKKLIAEIKRSDGTMAMAQILTTDVFAKLFGLSSSICGNAGDTGLVDLYWTDDLPVVPGPGTPAAGFLLSQNTSSRANYTGSWQEHSSLLIERGDSNSMANLMNYMASLANGGEAIRPSWILHPGGRLELFRDNN